MVVLEQCPNKSIQLVMPNGELLTVEYIGEYEDGKTKLAFDSTTNISVIRRKTSYSEFDEMGMSDFNVAR